MFSEYDFSLKKPIERILFLAFITVLILLGTHTKLFSLIAFVICALEMLLDKSKFKLMMMIYLMLLAHIFKISPTGMSYFTFLMMIYIGLKLIEEKSLLLTVVFFSIYMVVVQVVHSNININEDVKLIGNLLFIGYSLGELCSYTEKEKETLCITYIVAVIVSSFMRFFDSPFFNISAYTRPLKSEGYGAGVDRLVRFSGLYQDPNYYTVNLIIALCLIVILYYKGNTSKFFCVGTAGLILYFGTLTYSKSFLFILILPLVVFMYANHRRGRTDVQVLSVLLLVVAVAIVLVSNPDYVYNMTRRVETKESITTGRADIWVNYFDYMFHNPGILLFGKGFAGRLVNDAASHNFYVEVLYYLGIFGTLMLIIVIANSGLQFRPKRKLNLLNFSVLLTILITYFFLSQLRSYELPIHFMFAYMVMFQWDLGKSGEAPVQEVCTPLIPGLLDGNVKTLLPKENRK